MDKIDFNDDYTRRVLSVGLKTLLRQHAPGEWTVEELVRGCAELTDEERRVVTQYLNAEKLVEDL